MQLSRDGGRQSELGLTFNLIEALVINPYDRSLVVVDEGADLLYLFDASDRLISESRTAGGEKYLSRPSKLHIE